MPLSISCNFFLFAFMLQFLCRPMTRFCRGCLCHMSTITVMPERNASRGKNPCYNFTQETQRLTNHITLFRHVVVSGHHGN